jgi:hypothetical protein
MPVSAPVGSGIHIRGYNCHPYSTCLPWHHTNSHLAPLRACFWGIPLLIRGITVLTSPLNVSSSLDMSPSTSRPSPSPPSLLRRRNLISCCRLLALLQLHPRSTHPRMSSSRDLHPLFCRSFLRMTLPSLCVAPSFAWRLCPRRLSPDRAGLD